MEYIFICGKNFALSVAEITSYLKARSIGFEITDFSDPFIAIKAAGLPNRIIYDLGGTIKIAESVFSSSSKDLHAVSKEIVSRLDFDRLFMDFTDKANFGFSSYNSGNEQVLLSSLFKEEMKKHGIRAGTVHIQEGSALTHVEVIKKHLVDRGMEIIACRGKLFYLGKTIAIHNPFDFQKRDVGRPAQRAIYSIPPRLSKIMINLGTKPPGILLDPFCGMGSILQEAILMGFDVRGLDNDRNCIQGCIRNLEWLQNEYRVEIKGLKGKVLVGDARNLSSYFQRGSIDAVVTEPYLGPPLKSRPKLKRARTILNEVSPLFEQAIREMTKVLRPGGRIVITSPSFEIGDEVLELNVESLARRNGLRIVDPLEDAPIPHTYPLYDFGERHKTLRKISVFEK